MIICMVKKSTKATTFIIYCRQIHRLRTDAIFSYDKNVEHASKWKRIIVLQVLKTKPLFNKHIDNKLQCYLFQYCLVLIDLSDTYIHCETLFDAFTLFKLYCCLENEVS